VRVAIAEDSVLLREGLTRLLEEAGHEVIAAEPDAERFLRAVAADQPDAAVIDVRMPPTFTDEGLRAALVVRDRWPDVGVLVLSQWVEEQYATELIAGRARGVGYLLKDRVADVTEFLDALTRVAEGGSALDPEVVAQLLARSRHPLGDLTPREREVLALMAEGRSNAAIAAALVVGGGAVEKHINNIFTKLGLAPGERDHRRVLAVLRYLSVLSIPITNHLSPELPIATICNLPSRHFSLSSLLIPSKGDSDDGACPRSSPAHVPEGEANARDAPPDIQDVGSCARTSNGRGPAHDR
jgi:DNA-binding NarL/FixJ family response regulator